MRCHSQAEFYKNITELVITYKSPYFLTLSQKEQKVKISLTLEQIEYKN